MNTLETVFCEGKGCIFCHRLTEIGGLDDGEKFNDFGFKW